MAEAVRSTVNVEMQAVYLHGSAVLGGWRAATSDVDVLVLLSRELDRDRGRALCSAALSTMPTCPGTGLELSAVTLDDAADPRPPWRFVAHVAASVDGPRRAVLGPDHPGDDDLRLHYAVCRQAGWPVFGPRASDLIGPVARLDVLQALADELTWALQHAPAHYALLNTCRALALLQQEQLVGKITGGQWALDQGIGPAKDISEALATQTGVAPAASLTAAGEDFVRQAVDTVTGALGSMARVSRRG